MVKKITKLDFDSKYYPDKLRQISNPPKCLYAIGNIDILNKEGIAIIGSRKNSEYGNKWCKHFTAKLVEYELNIISGMALGIDSISHNICLENNGNTIAVLPCGFNNIYPRENTSLFEKIIDGNGVIVTEYEPNVIKKSQYCLDRNRIVSGLAIATLVIEARLNSGTGVTARFTKEQGKYVFCIPSSLDNKKGMGTNNLIKKGAILVTEINDIISKFKFLENKQPKKTEKNKNIEKEYLLSKYLIEDEPISIDSLIKISGLSTGEVISQITMMELEEYVKVLPGNIIIKI